MHFCEQHTSYSFDPLIVIVGVYLGLYSLSLLWPLLLGPLRLCALTGNMAEALAIVALYPLATLGMSVCGTNIHRCTTARWSAGNCSLQEVLGILIRALTLQLQGLELGQEVVNSLAGALTKMQELGPCPLLIIYWEKEGLDLCLQCGPGWPCVCCHTLIKVNLCKVACMRALQAQVNSHHLLLVRGSVMGGCDADLDLGPPLVELLGRPIIGLRGCNNFLSRNSTCCSGP